MRMEKFAAGHPETAAALSRRFGVMP